MKKIIHLLVWSFCYSILKYVCGIIHAMKENFEQEFKKDGIEQIKELLGSLENSSKEQELLNWKLTRSNLS